MRRKLLGLLLGLGVLAAACSSGETTSSEPRDTVPATESTSTPAPALDGQPVGPEGGTVTSDDGSFSVEIPPGALGEETSIAIETAIPAELGLNEEALDGPVYQLLPDGLTFEVPVTTVRTLSASELGVPDDEIPFFQVLQGLGDDWEPLSTNTSRDGDVLTVRAETSHFSANVVFNSIRVWGEEVRAALSPGSFTAPTGGSQETNWGIATGPDLAEDGIPEDTQTWSHGAVLDHEKLPGAFGKAVCDDSPGEGTYTVELLYNFEDATPEALFAALLLTGSPFAVPDIEWDISVTGKATCTEVDLSLLESILGISRGEVSFKPGEGASGVPFSGPFTFDLQSGYVVEQIQEPDQKTTGMADPVSGYAATLAVNDLWFDFYFGGVCPRSDGSFWVYGINLGGDPALTDQLQAFLDSIKGVEARIDAPANPPIADLVPGWNLVPVNTECDDLDEEGAFGRAEAIRELADYGVFAGPLGWNHNFVGDYEPNE